MKKIDSSETEKHRLSALNNLNILDTQNEIEFDNIVRLACSIAEVPVGAFSLVDHSRQWFKAKQGLEVSETAREISFCTHTIQSEAPLEICDAKLDPRFVNNPLVLGDPKIRFYYGVPVRAPNTAEAIGTLCVIDRSPKKLSVSQVECLIALRDQLEQQLLIRQKLIEVKNQQIRFNTLMARQEHILEGAGLGAWDWWLDTNAVNFDRRWCEMLGLDPNSTPQELSTWDKLVHPEDRAKAYEDIKLHLSGKTEVYQNIHRLQHANGDWIWILDRGKISERDAAGKPLRFTGTHLDITHFKKQEILAEKVQAIAQVGGWELDLETGHTSWTAQTYEIHKTPEGTPTDKIMGINFYQEHDRPRLIECLNSCRKGVFFREKFEFTDAQGVKKWVDVSGIPVLNALGQVTKITGTIQDITLGVKAEQALEASRLKTLHASKMASLGQVAAGVAHEINTPLAAAQAALSLLAKEHDGLPTQQRKAQMIARSLDRISSIVRGLRTYSRTSDGGAMKPTPLSLILEGASVLAGFRAKAGNCKLVLQIIQDGEINCAPEEIEQVIVNLVNNAVDAAGDWSPDTVPQVGIEKASAEDATVTLKSYRDGDKMVVDIIDTGPGISAEASKRLFEPFFTTKPIGRGTGLGLSISKGIMDRHNSSIENCIVEGRNCFRVQFKLAQESRNQKPNAA